jgi:hypothetical protein
MEDTVKRIADALHQAKLRYATTDELARIAIEIVADDLHKAARKRARDLEKLAGLPPETLP